MSMSSEPTKNKKPKQHYRTTNWHEYDAALTARGSLLSWFGKEMQWLSEPGGKNGRPAKYSDAAITFSLSLKCLYNLPLRQSLGLVEILLQLAQLDWDVPDHTMVCRRQRTLQVQIGYRLPVDVPFI